MCSELYMCDNQLRWKKNTKKGWVSNAIIASLQDTDKQQVASRGLLTVPLATQAATLSPDLFQSTSKMPPSP